MWIIKRLFLRRRSCASGTLEPDLAGTPGVVVVAAATRRFLGSDFVSDFTVGRVVLESEESSGGFSLDGGGDETGVWEFVVVGAEASTLEDRATAAPSKSACGFDVASFAGCFSCSAREWGAVSVRNHTARDQHGTIRRCNKI